MPWPGVPASQQTPSIKSAVDQVPVHLERKFDDGGRSRRAAHGV